MRKAKFDALQMKIGDIVYIELGSMEDHYIQCEGFLNTKILVQNYHRGATRSSEFLKCLFLVLPADDHKIKSSCKRFLSKVPQPTKTHRETDHQQQ